MILSPHLKSFCDLPNAGFFYQLFWQDVQLLIFKFRQVKCLQKYNWMIIFLLVSVRFSVLHKTKHITFEPSELPVGVFGSV